MISRTIARVVVASGIALGCASAASAHHSSAMYDRVRLVTLRGVVTQFRWTSPHVTMMIRTDPVKGHDGDLWVVEATSPGNLSRNGWTRTSLRVGDRVEIVAAPLRDGGHGAYCQGIALPDKRSRLEC
jgi:hypothetical protein